MVVENPRFLNNPLRGPYGIPYHTSKASGTVNHISCPEPPFRSSPGRTVARRVHMTAPTGPPLAIISMPLTHPLTPNSLSISSSIQTANSLTTALYPSSSPLLLPSHNRNHHTTRPLPPLLLHHQHSNPLLPPEMASTPPSPNWRCSAPRRGVHGTMVHEQHARIRIAQPDTSGRRRADETDPVRHGADKGLRRDGGGGLGIPHARYRACGVGPGYARKMEVSRARRRSRGVGARGEEGRVVRRGSGRQRQRRRRCQKRGGARPRWSGRLVARGRPVARGSRS